MTRVILRRIGVLMAGLLVAAAGDAVAAAAPRAATNDATATFGDRVFSLPDLPGPKDAYLVIVQPAGGGEAIKWTLPAGTTGFKVLETALPPGAWTWSYKVSAATPARMDVSTPLAQALRADEIPLTKKLNFTWPAVAGAVKYSLSGTTRTRASRGDENPKEGKFATGCDAVACVRGGTGLLYIGVEPGMEITWKVSALDKDDVVIADSAEGHIAIANTGSQTFKAKGFTLQRSDTLSKADATKPALLSWQSERKDDAARTAAWQARFALIYDGPKVTDDLWLRTSAEGHLTSTGEDKASDALVLRTGAYRHIFENANRDQGTEWVTNLKYETEHKSGTKKGLLELGFTPLYGWLGTFDCVRTDARLDAAGNQVGSPWICVNPTLLLGLEAGKTFDVGSSKETKDTIVRLKTDLRLDTQLGTLAKALNFRQVTAYLEGTWWYLPGQDGQKNYRLGTAGLSFGLNENVSFDIDYSSGREAPDFTFARSATVGVGLKF